MGILDLFGKKDAAADLMKGSPFLLATELVPYRLHARKSSTASLRVRVRNVTKDVVLASVVAVVPDRLGFDQMMMTKQREIRIGEMPPGEQKEIKFDVFSGTGSDAGEYTVNLTAIAHYRDYSHVLNAVKKRVQISVV